jgi:hypothetical protein
MPSSQKTLSPVQLYHDIQQRIQKLPPNHAFRVLVRVYGLAVSLSIGPALLSIVGSSKNIRAKWTLISRLLRRHLGVTGFPFTVALALSGGTLPQLIQQHLNGSSPHTLLRINERTSFTLNAVSSYLAMTLLQSSFRRRTTASPGRDMSLVVYKDMSPVKGEISPTWDITLIFLVRAMDSWSQRALSRLRRGEADTGSFTKEMMSGRLDAGLFWIASWRCVYTIIIRHSCLMHT